MTPVRHGLSAPAIAVVGVVAGGFLAAGAVTVAILGGTIAATELALLVLGELALVTVGVTVAATSASGVEELERAAVAIEEGERSPDLPTDRSDGVGTVATALDDLVEAVVDAEARATKQHQRAEERAAELSALSAALTTHAEAFDAAMVCAADGDLTARIEAEAEDQRLAELATEFDAMLGNIEETTDRLKRFASDVATHGEEVTASAEEVKDASEQVSVSVQEISETTETQSRTFERVADRIDELAATTQAIATRAENVSRVAERTAETGQRGREAARDAAMAMESIDASSASATEEMDELERLVDEIDEVAEFISEIAEEVNVLALNANIEASRSAEDDNEGFAVVAKEVKDLAAETKFSAQRIENLVGEVKVQTELSSSEVQSTRDAVTEGRETVEDAIGALEEIAGFARETHEGVLEITAATDEQAETTEDVVSMVDHAAKLSREVDAEAGTVAAAAEQQTSALTEVTEGTGQLSAEAQSLRNALDRFETDVEPDDAVRTWLPDPPSDASVQTNGADVERPSVRDGDGPDDAGSDRTVGATGDRSADANGDLSIGTSDDAAPATNGTGGSHTSNGAPEGADDTPEPKPDGGDAWPGDWSSTDRRAVFPEEE